MTQKQLTRRQEHDKGLKILLKMTLIVWGSIAGIALIVEAVKTFF